MVIKYHGIKIATFYIIDIKNIGENNIKI